MNCNQNCNQGRRCDCVPDIDEPDYDPISMAELAGVIVKAALVLATGIALVFMLGISLGIL